MTFEEYIKKAKRKILSFVNKEGLFSWLEDAYKIGYNEAIRINNLLAPIECKSSETVST